MQRSQTWTHKQMTDAEERMEGCQRKTGSWVVNQYQIIQIIIYCPEEQELAHKWVSLGKEAQTLDVDLSFGLGVIKLLTNTTVLSETEECVEWWVLGCSLSEESITHHQLHQVRVDHEPTINRFFSVFGSVLSSWWPTSSELNYFLLY